MANNRRYLLLSKTNINTYPLMQEFIETNHLRNFKVFKNQYGL